NAASVGLTNIVDAAIIEGALLDDTLRFELVPCLDFCAESELTLDYGVAILVDRILHKSVRKSQSCDVRHALAYSNSTGVARAWAELVNQIAFERLTTADIRTTLPRKTRGPPLVQRVPVGSEANTHIDAR